MATGEITRSEKREVTKADDTGSWQLENSARSVKSRGVETKSREAKWIVITLLLFV